MKRIALAFFFILCFSISAKAQAVRIGPASVTSAVTTPGVISTVAGAKVSICTYPANAVPCTNYATTYINQAQSSTCPNNQQLVLDGGSSCVTNADNFGNWGAWVVAGTYSYTVTLPTGASAGPYTVTIGGAGGGGSGTVTHTPGPLTSGQMMIGNGAADSNVFSTGNSGGIPCFTASSVIAASAALNINVLPMGGGAGACPTNSHESEASSVFTTTLPIQSGTIPAGCLATITDGVCFTEGGATGFTPTAATDYLRADATKHAFLGSYNASTEEIIPLIHGTLTAGNCVKFFSAFEIQDAGAVCGAGGTVTSFSAGNLSPLFTTSVATPTTTPALSFTLSNAAANTVFGNPTTSSAAPIFTTNPAVTSIATGTSPPTCGIGTGTAGISCWGEGTAPTSAFASAVDVAWADATNHCLHANQNNVDIGCYAAVGANNAFTGNNTHSGTETFSGTLVCSSISGVICVTATGAYTTLQAAYNALPTTTGGIIWDRRDGATITDVLSLSTQKPLHLYLADATYQPATLPFIAVSNTSTGYPVIIEGTHTREYRTVTGIGTVMKDNINGNAITITNSVSVIIKNISFEGSTTTGAHILVDGGSTGGQTTAMVEIGYNGFQGKDNAVKIQNVVFQTEVHHNMIQGTNAEGFYVDWSGGSADVTLSIHDNWVNSPGTHAYRFTGTAGGTAIKFNANAAGATNTPATGSAMLFVQTTTGMEVYDNDLEVFPCTSNCFGMSLSGAGFNVWGNYVYSVTGTNPPITGLTMSKSVIGTNLVQKGVNTGTTAVSLDAASTDDQVLSQNTDFAGEISDSGTNNTYYDAVNHSFTFKSAFVEFDKGPIFLAQAAPAGVAGFGRLYDDSTNGALEPLQAAPASVSTTPGTNAGANFVVPGVAGGASSNAAGVGGVGSAPSISGGTGGAGTGTNASGGTGGAVNLTAGNGGASLGTAANSGGGSVILSSGSPGTGGSGTAGAQGTVSVNIAGTGNMIVSRTTCVNVTPVTVSTSTTSDQNLMSCTLAANLLNTVGRTLKIFTRGVYSTAATSTAQMTLKVKLCTVSGCGSGTVISLQSIQTTALGSVTVANNGWNLTCNSVTQTAGASASFEAGGFIGMDLGALTAADSLFTDTNTATVGTISTTGQLFLQISGAFSAASASNSFTERELIVEVVN